MSISIHTLGDNNKNLEAENKEFVKAAKEFKKIIEDLQNILREKEKEIELIKLEKENLKNELERCSGIKPSEDEDEIIAQFIDKFKNEVYKVEKKFLDLINNIPKNSVENANQRKIHLQQLISTLTQIKYSLEYSINDLNLSNSKLSDKLNNVINNRIDEGIDEYTTEI